MHSLWWRPNEQSTMINCYVNNLCSMKLHSLTVDVKTILVAEAATRGVLCKKVFWEISQNLQENTCQSLFFDKVAGLF